MINEATKIFIPSSCGGDLAASNDFLSRNTYYEQLVYTAFARGVTTDSLNLLGRQLASLARVAYATRRFDDVENISQLMRALPLPKTVQAVTDYHEGLRLRRAGQFDAAERMLYRAVEDASLEYKPRILLALGNNHDCKGYIDSAVTSFGLAGKLGREHDPLVFLQSQQGLAHIHGTNGDSPWAVKTLESSFPSVLAMARTCPIIYYMSLNNYAVRLGEVGRVDEAQASEAIIRLDEQSAKTGCAKTAKDEATKAQTQAKKSCRNRPRAPLAGRTLHLRIGFIGANSRQINQRRS